MRLITIAIHTYNKALAVRTLLESQGVKVTLQNVNLEHPEVSSGVRIRIAESDLPLALRIIENPDIFDKSVEPETVRHPILVPTDFSERSYSAARIAIKLAAHHKADVKFLHSYIDPHITGTIQLTDKLTYEPAQRDAVESLVKVATIGMEKFTTRLKEEMRQASLPVVKYSHDIVEGVPEDAILEYAKEHIPFLIVMGTRQADKKERELIGSVTAEVLDECRFSVLTIPEEAEEKVSAEPANILFFSNLDQQDLLAMDSLYRFFPHTEAKVTIVNIPPKRRFSDKAIGNCSMALSEYCERNFDRYSFKCVPVSPKNAIDELIRLEGENKYDLIVVPYRRKNALSRLFNPGIAHRILFRADIPMLVIPV